MLSTSSQCPTSIKCQFCFYYLQNGVYFIFESTQESFFCNNAKDNAFYVVFSFSCFVEKKGWKGRGRRGGQCAVGITLWKLQCEAQYRVSMDLASSWQARLTSTAQLKPKANPISIVILLSYPSTASSCSWVQWRVSPLEESDALPHELTTTSFIYRNCVCAQTINTPLNYTVNRNTRLFSFLPPLLSSSFELFHFNPTKG